MKITLQDIQKIKSSEVVNTNYFRSIKGISIDSRKVKKGDLFFAIKGDNFDGHDFVTDVLKKGAVGIVISKENIEKFKYTKSFIVAVHDTTIALGDLANIYRKKFKVKIIAITGSNGKTTTKEMIAAVLSQKYTLLKTEGSLNNHFGVPLTLFRLNDNHEIAVIEMGINHPGELTRLCEIAEPDFGCITNIGNAHVEFFDGIEGIAKAKGELFDYLATTNGFGLVNGDDKRIRLKAKRLKQKLTYGYTGRADIKGKFIELNKNANPHFSVSYRNCSLDIYLKTFGKHTSYNALCAAAFGSKFGVPSRKIKAALESYSTLEKRMQVLRFNGITVLNDSYNANPDSMKAAFDTLSLMNGFDLKIAAVGDMLELGKNSKKFHEQLVDFAKKAKVDYLLCYGELTKHTNRRAKELNLKSFRFSDKKKLTEKLNSLMKKNSVMLVKGSRKMKMEEILESIKK
ncbi:MAG: UDP-N-acetylmuramoyl-tripeptide--D-alanyl-D-alanine ligase [Bacteroidetes bacterium]|nr:UDP-N-acetylmuramoyl-tripeptide--D-alanyl-D-alanine ligase [Bacteroidota bacterium]